MFEVLNYYLPKIKKSKILSTLDLVKEKYFVISAHREENIEIEKNFKKVIKIIEILAEEFNLPVIISTHPRTQKRLKLINKGFHHKVKFIKPLGFCDYINLQINSKIVLSDSGTITEESSIQIFQP